MSPVVPSAYPPLTDKKLHSLNYRSAPVKMVVLFFKFLLPTIIFTCCVRTLPTLHRYLLTCTPIAESHTNRNQPQISNKSLLNLFQSIWPVAFAFPARVLSAKPLSNAMQNLFGG